MVTAHGPVPVHPPPLQPVNVEPVAHPVTAAGHVPPAPPPSPSGVTGGVNLCGAKVAVSVVAAVIVTTHGPVPVRPPPDQPVKVDPVAGAAVRVTAVL